MNGEGLPVLVFPTIKTPSQHDNNPVSESINLMTENPLAPMEKILMTEWDKEASALDIALPYGEITVKSSIV